MAKIGAHTQTHSKTKTNPTQKEILEQMLDVLDFVSCKKGGEACVDDVMKAVFLKKSTLNYFYSYSVTDETCYDCEHMKCLPIMLLLCFLFSLHPNSSQPSHVLSLVLWTKPLLCLSFRSLIWMIFVTHPFPHLTLKFCPSLTDFFCIASVCKDFCVSFEQTKILFYSMDKFSLLYSCLCTVLHSCLLLCALSCASSGL